jgi:DNA (cytosine-5)-methyltransferase 1
MVNGIVRTLKTEPQYDDKRTTLKDVIQNGEVTADFYINEKDIDKWLYLKGAKKELRKNAAGFEYNYSEGENDIP